MTSVGFEAERWYADRGRQPLRFERVDRLAELELVRVEFDTGKAALYTVFESEPDWSALLRVADGAFVVDGEPPVGEQRRLTVDQSHSSWRIGDAYLKCYRRLVPGVHPEVELGLVLGREVPEHVPRLRASLHWRANGESIALAVVQDFVGDAEEGWDWAAARCVAGDAAFAGDVGAVARKIHDALARELGIREATAADRSAWRGAGDAQLDEALELVGGELKGAEPRIRRELARLEDAAATPVTRIHGDLHVGQFLHAPGRLVVVDFEGQPGKTPVERRAFDTPLRDLASLVRSVDHCGRYAVERYAAEPARAEAWIDTARSNLLAGYGPHDAAMLRALEWERAVYEFTYAARYLPEWLYAPRGGLHALLEVPE